VKGTLVVRRVIEGFCSASDLPVFGEDWLLRRLRQNKGENKGLQKGAE
jgi:hypothetical protein